MDMLKAKRDGKHITVRCGGRGDGRGDEMIGRLASLCEPGKPVQIVTITALVRDYGAGDVCVFDTDTQTDVPARVFPARLPAPDPTSAKRRVRRATRRSARSGADSYGTGHPWAAHDESDD